MGAESSRPAPHRREYAPSSVGDAGSSGPSLWEGVPGPVLSLVQSQVRLLLTQHTSALIHRPESLYLEEDEDDGEEGAEAEGTADGSPSAPKLQSSILAPTDEALAHGALRDRVIGGRLQRALDRLVPSQMSEAAFWDNFFSHVDVIKVRLVTEFLVAREGAAAERTAKHEAWVALYDSMESEMREDVRRAAERIAARQQPRPPSAIELALGLDGQRAPKWTPDGDAWLEYIEDGPDEIVKVLKAARAHSPGAVEGESPAHKQPGELPVWRSPDEDGRHKVSMRRLASYATAVVEDPDAAADAATATASPGLPSAAADAPSAAPVKAQPIPDVDDVVVALS